MTLQSERARFEEWIGQWYNCRRISTGEYHDSDVNKAWEAWCAALGIKEDQ